MPYQSSKTYGHDIGLSCAFRQHRTDSHCQYLHGYALSVHIEFEADDLDENNWVVDFGGLKSIKEWLKDTFDHKTVIAEDDPHLVELSCLEDFGLAQIVVLPNVGCEAFARHVGEYVERWLEENDYSPRVALNHVTIREHGANSATWMPEQYVNYGNMQDRIDAEMN